ncbi:aminoacyl-tRNA hydrolase [Peptostreptococcus stomatis]|uniref:aminoacyl-tRNA hydrolase n=1 Tax=Peptostreptococcus stomatis TaxID=341694 RepID=UPI0039966300
MYIIVGLGNPGKKYEHTRHNAGFDVLDILAEEYGIKIDKIKHKALIGEGRIGSEKVVLVKPQTYMNLSGESVQSVFQFYKVDMDHLIVVYDDIDLDIGKLRIRKKGSAGSHNGMKSIIKCLGSQEFPRVRVGVSRPDPNRDLADFVLSRVSKDQAEDMKSGLEKAVKTVEEIIRTDIDMAMNKYNG